MSNRLVVALRDDCGAVPESKVRAVRAVLDRQIVMPGALLKLAQRMAADYGATTLVVGDRTASRETIGALERLGIFGSIVRISRRATCEPLTWL